MSQAKGIANGMALGAFNASSGVEDALYDALTEVQA